MRFITSWLKGQGDADGYCGLNTEKRVAERKAMSNTPMDPFNAKIANMDDIVKALFMLQNNPGVLAVDATVAQYRIDLGKVKAENERLKRDIEIDRMGMGDLWCNQCNRLKQVRGRDWCGPCLAASLSTTVDEMYVAKSELKEARSHLSEFTDRTIAAETQVGDLRKALKRIGNSHADLCCCATCDIINAALEDTK